jgi:hypothetical protein
MWSRSRTKSMRPTIRTTTALIMVLVSGLGTMLAGCSDIYFDRRETLALGADDHIASDQVVQMIDPWPPHVGNRNIAFNGEKMQTAVERYRTNRVIPPIDTSSSSAGYAQAQAAAAAAVNATMSAPAAPVK